MIPTNLIGVDCYFAPISNAFKIDIINKKSIFKNRVLSIVKATFSISSEFINCFTVFGKNYSCIYINIEVRFDYICNNNNLNYELVSLSKLINICSDDIKCDNKSNMHSSVLDSSVLNINGDEVDFNVVYGCCLC